MTETGIGSASELTAVLGGMTADEAVRLVRELCVQLRNEQREFHGNIWPGNVKIMEDGRAILGEPSDTPVSERRAVQVEYVAPEYFWDNSGTPAADVYSLGLILYAGCNGGYLPFQPRGGALTDKDRSGALRKRMKGEELRVPATVSDGLQSVLNTALAYEPEDRYADPSELLAALGATDEALPSAAPEAEEPREADAFVLTPDADAIVDEDLAWLQAEDEPQPAQPEAPAKKEETRYAVQKDFESARARKQSAAPASLKKQKKRVSPAIPILCVAAVGIIGGAVYLGLFHDSTPKPKDEVSEPYVIETDMPDSTAAPAAETQQPETPAPEATPQPEGEPEDTPVPTGSETVDGLSVTAVSDTVYLTGSGVNLRSGPSTTYDIALTLPRGTKLTRTGTVNGWSQVQYEGEEYYVSSSLISTTDPLGREEETQSVDSGNGGNSGESAGDTGSAGGAVQPKSDTVTVTELANLRTGPGTDNSIVTTVAAGTKLERTGVTGSWSRVTYSGQTVYIHNNLITTGSTGSGANGSAIVTTPAPVTPSGSGSVTTTTPSTPAPTPTPTLQRTMDKLASDGTTSDAAGELKVVNDVNVRTGASTDDSIIAIAKAGEKLTVTGVKDGKWYKVSYNGQEGYVNRMLITLTEFTLITEKSGTATVNTYSNIRSGPSTDYEIYGQADKGDTLTLTGKTDNGWYRVTYNDKTAYIAENLVDIS